MQYALTDAREYLYQVHISEIWAGILQRQYFKQIMNLWYPKYTLHVKYNYIQK